MMSYGFRAVIGTTAVGLAIQHQRLNSKNAVEAGIWNDVIRGKWQKVVEAAQELFAERATAPPKSVIVENAKEEGYIIDPSVYGPDVKAHWNEDNMNYAIIGSTGAGKSTFANTFAGRTGIEEDACKDGVAEMTGVKSKIQCLHLLPESKINDQGKGQIVFWDLPGWGTTAYSKEEYIKKLGLPIYRGIILINSTRCREDDAVFYSTVYDTLKALIPDDMKQVAHAPVYIVRTKFDRDLRRELKKEVRKKYSFIENNNESVQVEAGALITSTSNDWKSKVLNFFWPQPLLTHDEFQECWDKTINEIKTDFAKEFVGVFDKDEDVNTNKLLNRLFILSGDWDNRMLTLSKDHNQADARYQGFPGLRRTVLLDPIVCAKNYDAQQRKIEQTTIDGRCDEILKNSPTIIDSELYKIYTAPQYELRHKIMGSLIVMGSVLSVLWCGHYTGYKSGIQIGLNDGRVQGAADKLNDVRNTQQCFNDEHGMEQINGR